MKRAISVVIHALSYFALASFVTDGLVRFDLWTVIFAGSLITISQVDFERFEIPDMMVLFLVILGGVRLYLHPPVEPLWTYGIAAILWPALLYAVARIYLHARGFPGLGFGDVKLMSPIGIWTGLYGGAATVFLASITGIAVLGSRRILARSKSGPFGTTAIAFGPFLCAAAWVIWLQENYQ